MNGDYSTSILNTIDFNRLTLENVFLFKSYLFVKIIKKKLKNLESFPILNKIENKLLLKIIDLCLINNNSLRKDLFKVECNEEACQIIYNLLLDEYKNLDQDENGTSDDNLVSDDFEANIMELLSQIQTFTKLVDNESDEENKIGKSAWVSLRDWFINNFYKFNVNAKKSFPIIATSSIDHVSEQEKQHFVSLKVFRLTDKMKIEDLMLKILDFIIIRARYKFDSRKYTEVNKVSRAQNGEYLNDLSHLIKFNKQLNEYFTESSNIRERGDNDETEFDEREFESVLIPTTSHNLSKTSSLISNRTSGSKRKHDDSLDYPRRNGHTNNFSTESSNGYPNSIKIKRFQNKIEDDDMSVFSQNEINQFVNENEEFDQEHTEDEDEIDDVDNNHNKNEPVSSKKQIYYSNVAFDHSYKSNRFLSNAKSSNVEKHISIPFDDLLKFHPLTLAIEKLPGIGVTYAHRLQNYKIKTFGDLVDFYQIKCKCNDQKFSNHLKEMTLMKIDSINKILSLIKNYSIQIKSLS